MNQKDYELKFDTESQTVKAKATCLLTQEIRKQILLSVASLLELNDASRVLIDLPESMFQPGEAMLGALELTNFMHAIGIQPRVKFAFIYSEAETHRKYFENIARSEGFNLRYFKTSAEAEEWLKK